MKIQISLFLLCIFSMHCVVLKSQERKIGAINDADRPRVGLVLSGGSAHGLAHIGVIKYLEEQGIHIDYVTGTSMGSIIGGLFAMGLNASEIEQVANDMDWDLLLNNEIPLNEIAPSEKPFRGKSVLNLQYRNGDFNLPQEMINSQQLDLTINRLFCQAYAITDFDDLPYPFRCMGVDIEKGEVVEMSQGYLGQAIRASMAIPSIFSPVERDGRLLVDGGLIRNFPVKEAIDLGADIIIGVYVGSQLESRDHLNSLIDMLNQSAFMMSILDSEEQKKNVDILIVPDVKEMGKFDFENIRAFVEKGYESSEALVELIQKLVEEQSKYDIISPTKLNFPDHFKFKEVNFPQTSAHFTKLARFKFGADDDLPSTIEEVEAGISRIFGTGHFEKINYNFLSHVPGESALEIMARPKEEINLGVNLNSFSSTKTAVILQGELRNILGEPSVLYSRLRVAENFGISGSYIYRLGKNKDFLFEMSGKVHKYEQNVYELDALRRKFTEVATEWYMGLAFEPNNVLILSLEGGLRGYKKKPIGFIEDGLVSYGQTNLFSEFSIKYHSLNALQFASEGWNLSGSASLIAPQNERIKSGRNLEFQIPQTENFYSIQMRAMRIQSILSNLSVSVKVEAGYNSQETFTETFEVGGMEERSNNRLGFIGLNTFQYHFSDFLKAGLSIQLEVYTDFFLSARLDYIEGRRTFHLSDAQDLNREMDFWGYGVSLGYRSPFGPVRLTYGQNTETHEWNTNFTIGYTFF